MDASDPAGLPHNNVVPIRTSPSRPPSDVLPEILEADGLQAGSYRHALIAGIIAMAVNFVIAGLKLGVYWLFYRSAALLSEGLHSLADGINSSILLVGIVRGNRLPDRTHPFGYGLEANFWALFASFILFFIAAGAVWGGVRQFVMPETHVVDQALISLPVEPRLYAIGILIISMVFEVYAVWTASRAVLAELGVESNLFSAIPKAFKHIGEAKVPTTRYVFFEDTLAFLGAFVAFVAIAGADVAVAQGLLSESQAHWPDAVASILIGLMLVALAYNLFMHNKGHLVGSAASEQVEKAIQDLVLSVHGVSHIHDLKTIDQGHTGLIINLTVEVEPDIPVKDVDDLTDHIKDKLSDTFKNVHQSQVFIQVLADESDVEWASRFDALIEEGRKQEVLKPRDAAMLRRAYDFMELVVQDVMVPRPDVEYVTVETPMREMAALMIETGHTRWPVFEEPLEGLLGIVHSRDVFRCMNEGKSETPLKDIIRDIDIYPETKSVSDLLEEFKRKKLRMAAVADEHGSFAGIVTIEDLMEEIVGEIWDEHEEEETLLQFLSSTRLLVSGKHNIEDINDQLDLNFPTDEFVTIGGFVFGSLGREPEPNDRVTFEDLTLTVDEVEGARVVTLIIESPQPFKGRHTDEASAEKESVPLE